ncbi:predicted protein [Corallococcus sp. CAG:1435]|nr:predicted protein [Corallococcus sp. CAG:1435]
MVFDDLFQNVPHLGVGTFHTFLCGFNVVALVGFHKFFHYKGLEQFQSHFLGNTALVKFEFRSYHDNGTSRVVDTFAQQVLTETSLLTTKQSGKGLQLSVACARLRTFASAVVQQTVHGILQHTLFVVDEDFRCVYFNKFFKTVVAVYYPAVQVVEVAGGVSASVKRHHGTQFRRKYRQYRQNHPFGAVAAFSERFHYVKTLDGTHLFCALIGSCNNFTQSLRFLFQIDVLQQFPHRFGSRACTEVLFRVFPCGGLRLTVLAHGEYLLVLHSALHGVQNNITLEVYQLFKILGGHVQNKTHSGRRSPEIPDVGNGCGKFDVSHTFTTNLGFGNLNAALFAHYSFVTYSLVLTAVTFPVLDGSENSFAEQAVFFRFLSAVVDGFRLFDFAEGPFSYLFGRSNSNLNGIEIVHDATSCQRVGTQRGYRLSADYLFITHFLFLPYFSSSSSSSTSLSSSSSTSASSVSASSSSPKASNKLSRPSES